MQGYALVIEDVKEMADLISLFLEKEGMVVDARESAEEGLELLKRKPYDIVILDLNLPGMDGFEFLGEARKISDCPVLVVTARDADEDLIAGLGQGADEYMTKPFSPRVLVARVRALVRRSRGAADRGEAERAPSAIRFGPYELDRSALLLRKGRDIVPLSGKEFAVLLFLAENAGSPQSPQTIYDAVWKSKYGDLTAVAVYVQRLRKKIEADPSAPDYLLTDYGRGYRFEPEPQREGEGA